MPVVTIETIFGESLSPAGDCPTWPSWSSFDELAVICSAPLAHRRNCSDVRRVTGHWQPSLVAEGENLEHEARSASNVRHIPDPLPANGEILCWQYRRHP